MRLSEARVSQLVVDGALATGGTFGEWLIAYIERLREQAAGRGQDLAAERAALARSQRVGQDLKNAVAQGEYAPIGLLGDVLAAAAAAVAAKFEALPGDLRKVCPDLPEGARTQIDATIAAARNEWVRSTSALLPKVLDELTEDDADDDQPVEDATEAPRDS